MRDLARRSFRWRVPLRWYLISLLAPLLIFFDRRHDPVWLGALRALAQNWLLLFTASVGIGDHDLTEQCRRGDRMDGVRLRPIPRSLWSAPAALLTTVFFWLLRFEFLCRHAIMGDHGAGAGHLPAPAAGQSMIAGLSYNSAGSSVLIAGLVPCHAQRHRELHRPRP